MLGVNPVTNMVFVPNIDDYLVRVIDGTTNTVVSSINPGGTPIGIAMDTTLNRLYVSDVLNNQIASFDGTTFAARKRVTVGSYPFGLAANPATGHVFADCQSTDEVVIEDGATEAVVTSVSDGSQPISVAVNPVTCRAYVANWNSGTVSVIQDTQPGSSTHLEFSTQPGSATRGALLAQQPVVVVKNSAGQTVSFNGQVAVTVQPVNSGAALSGASTLNFVNGVASFAGLSLDKPGRYTLWAYSGAMLPVSSTAFRVTPSVGDVIEALRDASGLQIAGSGDPTSYDAVPQVWPIGSIDMRDVALLARLAAGLS